MPQTYFEIEESRSITPWVNRLYFESPRASSFLGLRLVKTRHKNLVSLLSGVKPDPVVGSGRYAEPIPVKSPLGTQFVPSLPWSQIATNHKMRRQGFLICRNLWSRQWRHKPRKALGKMKCGKSAGLSGVVAEMLKAAGDDGVELIRKLAEAVFSSGDILVSYSTCTRERGTHSTVGTTVAWSSQTRSWSCWNGPWTSTFARWWTSMKCSSVLCLA